MTASRTVVTDRPAVGYGQKENVRQVFEKVIAGTGWLAFGYIASEADLKRMRRANDARDSSYSLIQHHSLEYGTRLMR